VLFTHLELTLNNGWQKFLLKKLYWAFGKKKSLPAYFGILEKNITFYVPQLGNHSPCDIVHNQYE